MNATEPMMRITCTSCKRTEILEVGRRSEVIFAIIHQTGRCLGCGSSALSYRELEPR